MIQGKQEEKKTLINLEWFKLAKIFPRSLQSQFIDAMVHCHYQISFSRLIATMVSTTVLTDSAKETVSISAMIYALCRYPCMMQEQNTDLRPK